MTINTILRTCTKKELLDMLKGLENDMSFGAGFKKSAIKREINRRKHTKVNK